ncbi:hypothetical protein B0H63DRAFT_529932 [Podospora didyma]|uniref:PRELI/MSF1 domain-containing protein n=1 Tax=Podospora didyma TaxID=330526 RepID=A0AAE0JZK3_9PEZI|nr:hypothetical protein B0H63DRAFT_529932 [Podospora didyma]
MVLTHTTNHTYSHPFPTVTLAFFLRYCSPQLNPFASHVLSTDTISSHIDPDTGRLHTTRIHLKKSRMPPAEQRSTGPAIKYLIHDWLSNSRLLPRLGEGLVKLAGMAYISPRSNDDHGGGSREKE